MGPVQLYTLDRCAYLVYIIVMTDVLFFYVVGCLSAASLAMAWFNSGLPTHAADLLALIFKNNTFIKSIAHDIVLGTRDDWDSAVFIRTIGQPFYVQLLVELLSCKVCLSFHLSFWISLIIVVCTPIAWPFIPVATLSWPYLVNVLLTKLK